MTNTPFTIAGRTFASRLIVGTGKYPSNAVMREAHVASGADMVTVAGASFTVTQAGVAVSVSAASLRRASLAPESIVSAFGAGLAPTARDG